MGTGWLALRIVHIGLGMFWVGADVFLTFLFLPRLRALGPEVERPVMTVLLRVLPPTLTISSVLTGASGIWMAGELHGWSPAWLVANGWGLSMLVGLVGTTVALAIGMGALPPLTTRYDKMNRAIAGRSATREETEQLRRLSNRVEALARLNSVLLIVVVIAMAVARYV